MKERQLERDRNESRTMKQPSSNRFISLSELCEILGLSKSRFYELQKAGVFPEPIRNPSNNRPVFDQALVDQCAAIVQSRVGANGQPVSFNRKKPSSTRGRKQASPTGQDKHTDLIEALSSLGLATTSSQIEEALKSLPNRGSGLETPALVRAVFLQLKKSA